MQGPIAQTLALAIHGNAALRGIEVHDFFPSHSTCTFCKSVSFVLLDLEGDEWRLRPFAASPQDWILRLRNAGATGFVVLWESLHDPRITDRESVGFVGGGGRWLIEVLLPRSAELWEAAWEAGDANDPGKRIWTVTWTRVDRRQKAYPIGAIDLDSLQADLESLLPEIADFARHHDLETFVPCFEQGLACLGLEAPLGEVHHQGSGPPGLPVTQGRAASGRGASRVGLRRDGILERRRFRRSRAGRVQAAVRPPLPPPEQGGHRCHQQQRS